MRGSGCLTGWHSSQPTVVCGGEDAANDSDYELHGIGIAPRRNGILTKHWLGSPRAATLRAILWLDQNSMSIIQQAVSRRCSSESLSTIQQEVGRRRTFAIISHPDAGKTTLTEKLLLFGGAINMAGTVKGRKASRHATSDWMALEQQRGISITSSVMQFPYRDRIINLLDTPGHEDFSEDTYRTLTAVDSALMVIDCAKGVEKRTIKLMDVCRLRDTPIMTFINKLDRDGREPVELLDEIESTLKIQCSPVTWPIGMGRELKGVYHLLQDRIYLYSAAGREKLSTIEAIDGLDSAAAEEVLGDDFGRFRDEVELVRGACPELSIEDYLAAKQSPVFFGSAISNFGVQELLDSFVEFAPPPGPRESETRTVKPDEDDLTGFVFKIQANMDPGHRDRIAFMRICSGEYKKGMRLKHVRSGKEMKIADAITFMAADRQHAETAYAGDILGIAQPWHDQYWRQLYARRRVALFRHTELRT